MKEKFKAYLEAQFRQIAPTKAAMQYRNEMLVKMMDRAQELRIKGITDEDLICNMVIAELGDFSAVLRRFESGRDRRDVLRHSVFAGIAIGIAIVLLLTIGYIVVGACTGIWHPTWLIMVGGIFAGIAVVLAYASVKLAIKKKFLGMRFLIAICEVLLTVFVFLLLQLVFKLQGSWLAFLAMCALLLGVDTAIGFVTGSRTRWFELPVFTETFCAMLYVILGIGLGMNGIGGFWHPGWVICLGGPIVLLSELSAFCIRRAVAKKNAHIAREDVKDEQYWTMWDDDENAHTGK